MLNPSKNIVFALRALARSPGFTAVIVATLALGIGANTAIFSIVDGVLLKPLPFRDPDRLLMLCQKNASVPQLAISELDYVDFRARTGGSLELGGFTQPGAGSKILSGEGDPVEIAASFITQNFLPLLGVTPAIGRNFLPEEDRRGGNQVAILSYGLWQSRFGGSNDILNRQVTLDSQKLQIVGVMGPEAYPAEADVFLPYSRANPVKPKPRNYHELNVIVRLGPVALPGAESEIAAISADLERSYPSTNAGIVAYFSPLREEIIGKVKEPVLILLAAVGLILLIACGNVVNLLLVRIAGKQKEIAIRAALGAGRRRIVWQFIVECLILSIAGAATGLLLAFWSMPLLRNLGAGRIPRLQHVGIDVRVLLFTAGIAVVAGLFFGLLPSAQYSAANLNRMLRAGGRTSRSDSGGLRNVLIVGEVALALVVLICATLLVRSFNHILQVDPGFREDHVLVAQLSLPSTQYKRAGIYSFYDRLLPRIAAIPGVISVSTSTALPLASTISQTRFMVRDFPVPEAGKYPITAVVFVGADLFKTLGIPILHGRTFTAEEMHNPDDTRCLINAMLADRFLGERDPIGRVILTDLAATSPSACQVIGVVGNTRLTGLDAPLQPALYYPSYFAKDNLVVRTATNPLTIAQSLRHDVAATDPAQPLSNIRTMDDVLSRSLSRRRFLATLLVIFSIVGLILAALGLYGVVSYSVAQRTQEMGVRMALGAARLDIFRLVLMQGLLVTGIGLTIGILATLAATRTMSSVLFGIGGADPLAFAAGCLLLLTISAIACFIPAWRATRIDPTVALRYE